MEKGSGRGRGGCHSSKEIKRERERGVLFSFREREAFELI
jgi:hypothetical protein